MFCPKCGASLGIDFESVFKEHTYGINVSLPTFSPLFKMYRYLPTCLSNHPKQARTFYGLNLDELEYKKGDGVNKVPPAGDLSGHVWDEDAQELK